MSGETLDPRVAELLSALLDGAVTEEERSVAEAWLERSPVARAEYQGLAEVKAALGGLGDVEVPFGFYERMLRQGTPRPEVASAVDRARSRRRSAGAVALALVASAAAFVVVGGRVESPVRPPIEAVAAGDAEGIRSLRAGGQPVRLLRQEADRVAWTELPEGRRAVAEGAHVWEDLTTEGDDVRVVVSRDGVVVTLAAEGVAVGLLVEAGIGVVEDEPARTDGIGERVRTAFERLLESLSLG
jgi:ferric-dicitrate binding protein FerR (iron transport regulator)